MEGALQYGSELSSEAVNPRSAPDLEYLIHKSTNSDIWLSEAIGDDLQ